VYDSSTTDYNYWDENYIVQALLGAVQFNNLKFDVEDSNDEEIDLSMIPQIGAAWGTIPKGEHLQYGLECSFLLGFQSDSVSFIAGGSGLHVKIETSMWEFDLAGGAYASLYLGKNDFMRIYAGAGPLLIFSNYDSEETTDGSDTTETRESAFGVGAYARTGLEFRIYGSGMLGIGLRGNWASVDFSNIGGSSDLSGISAFVSFTAGL
jgi:hypothetical protein